LYNAYYQHKLNRDIRFIVEQGNNNKTKILDLGCGTGLLSLPFLKRDCHVIAVDISAEMLDILMKDVPVDKIDNIKIIKSEAMKYVQDSLSNDTKYDAVVISALLHHLVDYNEFIKNAGKLVRAGGILYIAFEPLKQEIKSKIKYTWHKIIRNMDEYFFRLNLRIKGVEPNSVINSVDGFEIIHLDKFCVRRSSLFAFISDAIIGSENAFSIIARRNK
jgi:ubiquinone/menaquinone biosynthesis C-methylase UbiE